MISLCLRRVYLNPSRHSFLSLLLLLFFSSNTSLFLFCLNCIEFLLFYILFSKASLLSSLLGIGILCQLTNTLLVLRLGTQALSSPATAHFHVSLRYVSWWLF